ncbi:MAG: YkgJ family cysteine cluster protein [Gemmatimonadota bacterium]
MSDFTCQRCGACCRAPGRLFLTVADYNLLARDLPERLSVFFFSIRWRDECKAYVLECPSGCPFMLGNGCEIYELRPSMCRLFPLVWRESGLPIDVECPGLTCGSATAIVDDEATAT